MEQNLKKPQISRNIWVAIINGELYHLNLQKEGKKGFKEIILWLFMSIENQQRTQPLIYHTRLMNHSMRRCTLDLKILLPIIHSRATINNCCLLPQSQQIISTKRAIYNPTICTNLRWLEEIIRMGKKMINNSKRCFHQSFKIGAQVITVLVCWGIIK